MARSPKHSEETFKPVKTVLISQPRPERSPYFELEEKYGIKIDWRPFIHVEGVTEREFRRQRVNPLDYTAIIFTSKNAIEHFFRLCEATRITMEAHFKGKAVAYQGEFKECHRVAGVLREIGLIVEIRG